MLHSRAEMTAFIVYTVFCGSGGWGFESAPGSQNRKRVIASNIFFSIYR